MGIQSNVTIKSNVYVNKSRTQDDKEFISHVRGYDALKKIHSGLLTKVQRFEVEYGNPKCYFDKSGDKSFGIIIESDKPVFVCKCERTGCKGGVSTKGYSDCSKLSNFRKIERDYEYEMNDEAQYIAPDFGLLRYLDAEDKIIYLKTVETTQERYAPPEIIIKPTPTEISETEQEIEELPKTEKIRTHTEIAQLNQEKPTPIIETDDINSAKFEYKRIDKPEEIIKSKIEDKLIVNAGPGTGKTYSVINRLGYIINNDLVDPSNILVLCYSRSAVGVIKNRINVEISQGNFPEEASQLFNSIRTFDSFVTYMLSDEENEGTINNLNYDERIEKFIVELKRDKAAFEGLEYLIVDEMQDLVGVRARMVQAILMQIDCGFLLLGDMCQSIYDYQIKDENELNSYRYYEWLNSKFKTDVKRFELTKNVRQNEEIAMFSEYMREAILSDDSEKQFEALSLTIDALQEYNHIGNIRNPDCFNISNTTAILCRNNAEVSIISSELFARDIVHRISKKAQHIDLVPWVAKVLSTYTENRIGITAFRELVLSVGDKDADAKWKLLKTVATDDSENVLDVKLLVKLLVLGRELPSELDSTCINATTVSTIHRAKGSEHDDVLLISDNYNRNNNALDEIKVAYVALTRGKEQISFCDIPNHYKKQLDSKRWIATGRSKKSNKYHCSNIEIGIDGDIDPYSFVNKNIDDAKERQRYISTLKPGYLLDIWLIDRSYKIFHNGVFIGTLSDNIFYELRDAMNKTNRSHNLPNHLSNIYVNNIVTIANSKFNDVIAEPYNKSGLWLGVEISGFAKTSWS
jgi:DNA helicase-2/ATP-dependent DNA helicase PcrA